MNAENLEREKEQWLHTAGAVVAGRQKRRAPRDLGRLIGSITYQTSRGGSNVESPAVSADKIDKPNDDNTVLVGTAVDYAIHQEYGTYKMKAQPFARDALDKSRKQLVDEWRMRVRRALSGQ
jgi:HK97 gp10 family phage protein